MFGLTMNPKIVWLALLTTSSSSVQGRLNDKGAMMRQAEERNYDPDDNVRILAGSGVILLPSGELQYTAANTVPSLCSDGQTLVNTVYKGQFCEAGTNKIAW